MLINSRLQQIEKKLLGCLTCSAATYRDAWEFEDVPSAPCLCTLLTMQCCCCYSSILFVCFVGLYAGHPYIQLISFEIFLLALIIIACLEHRQTHFRSRYSSCICEIIVVCQQNYDKSSCICNMHIPSVQVSHNYACMRYYVFWKPGVLSNINIIRILLLLLLCFLICRTTDVSCMLHVTYTT